MLQSMLLLLLRNRHRRQLGEWHIPIRRLLMTHSETCQKRLKIESRVIVGYWKIRGFTQAISRG